MDEFDVIDIQPELRLIVNALAKAIGPDTRSYLTGSNMDTNNAIILLRGDFINTNLRDLLQPDFGTLTAEVAAMEDAPQKKDAHSLVKVRKDIKSKNSNEPDKKPEISTKCEEVGKQA